MFSKEYYSGKKSKLTQTYIKKMENALENIARIQNEFYADKRNLVEQIAEIEKLEVESMPPKEAGEKMQGIGKEIVERAMKPKEEVKTK
jgi:hypothetical protein